MPTRIPRFRPGRFRQGLNSMMNNVKTDSVKANRLDRIHKAVAMQKTDRVPVVLEYSSFAARVTDTPLPNYLLDLEKSVAVMKAAYELVAATAAADAVNYGCFSPYALSRLWLSKVKVPGIDLPVDASYQLIETESLTWDDYETILKIGWPRFHDGFVRETLLAEVPPEVLPQNQGRVDVVGKWAEIGVPVLSGGDVAPPFEFLCGGRSLPAFFSDLVDIPNKVEQVMEAIMPHLVPPVCASAKANGFPAVWIGGWRGAPALLSPKMWERFVWRYFKRLILEVLAEGLIPILHLDSDWGRELHRFKALPAGKIVMALDGETDIFRAKEILDGHVCLMGDVPAAMLAFDNPDTVYDYSRRLIRKIGPHGFILQSGCDIPENAKLENVQAMVLAALEG
jgi:Uroporphyrinogen decarboxylase (URO-D)